MERPRYEGRIRPYSVTSPKPPAIFLMGPTASGKTALAVELVKRLPCDIVSVDSAQVFRQLDIGTSKPGPEILAVAPHRLIDILDPADSYSAGRFRQDALREMQAIADRGRLPLLVGGTMLYFRALQRGLADLPLADSEVRAMLDARARSLGWAALHSRLMRLDPIAAARIHPNDPQRIQRALELYEITGRTPTELFSRQTAQFFPYRSIKLALVPASRTTLRERISRRFQAMLDQGLIAEVEALHRRGDLGPQKPSIRTVGYRQVWEYIGGKLGYPEMIERAIIATGRLAKRQLTWLRAEQDVAWFDSLDSHLVQKALKLLNL